MKTKEKLIKFEKYFRRQQMANHVKKNMVVYFHELFKEEMKNTPTGIKYQEWLNK